MEGTATTTGREARRRRIVERGSDRLALISGRIKTLPTESEASESETGSNNPRGHSHTASCPPSIIHAPIPAVDTPSDYQRSHDFPRNEDDGRPGSLLRNDGSVHEIDDNILSRSVVEPYMRKCVSSSGASGTSTLDCDTKGQASQVVPTMQSPRVLPLDTSHHSEPLFHQTKIITYSQVSAAFSATETARLHCALAIASLVILSYTGFPILGSRFLRGVIFFRPLYLLLLTNITVALAHLLEKQKGLQKPEQRTTGVPSVSSKGLADRLGSILELGWMLQNVTGALIKDCSIYAIIVICGLSLAQTFGF